ncbi:hypothetical protein L9F63_021314, partial [Diploptera punctata]
STLFSLNIILPVAISLNLSLVVIKGRRSGSGSWSVTSPNDRHLTGNTWNAKIAAYALYIVVTVAMNLGHIIVVTRNVLRIFR